MDIEKIENKVITFTDMGTTCLIGIDKGQCVNTSQELNIRIFSTLHFLKNISCSNAYVRKITESVDGYGCTIGDNYKLFPVTDDQICDLIQLNMASKKMNKNKYTTLPEGEKNAG